MLIPGVERGILEQLQVKNVPVLHQLKVKEIIYFHGTKSLCPVLNLAGLKNQNSFLGVFSITQSDMEVAWFVTCTFLYNFFSVGFLFSCLISGSLS